MKKQYFKFLFLTLSIFSFLNIAAQVQLNCGTPDNFDWCLPSSSQSQTQIQSSNGMPVTITITSGEVETLTGTTGLIISDGFGGPILYQSPLNQAPFDLTTIGPFTTVGDIIDIQFKSGDVLGCPILGPFQFTVTCAALPTPEIDIKGNSTSISDGDVSPSIGDDTYFGSTTMFSSTSRTFTIQNLGTDVLNLSGVTLSGSSLFSLTNLPASSIVAGGSSTFTVQFLAGCPNVADSYTATVSVGSDDADENPYTFAIEADLTGIDTDSDGMLNACDADDDNDGVNDPTDPDDTDFNICGDSDSDGCDDCSVTNDGFGPLSDSDPANDGTDTDGDGICDLTDSCNDPSAPTLTGVFNCPASTATLNISGSLLSATAWHIYTGSCGDVLVGTTTTGTFTTAVLTGNTTFFVRAEGGCVTPGSCTSVLVTVTPCCPSRAGTVSSTSASSYCVGVANSMSVDVNIINPDFSNDYFYLIVDDASGLIKAFNFGASPIFSSTFNFSATIPSTLTLGTYKIYGTSLNTMDSDIFIYYPNGPNDLLGTTFASYMFNVENLGGVPDGDGNLCGDVTLSSVPFTVTSCANNSWTGTTDTDWHTASNWSTNSVPSTTDEIIIPNVTNQPLASTAITVEDLTIEIGASLNIGSGAGLIIAANGSVTNNGTVTLKSDASGTAYLDEWTNGGTYVGNLTCERFVSNGSGEEQHMVSSPMNTAPLSELDDDVSGNGVSGLYGADGIAVTVDDCITPSLTSGSNYGNVFEFDQDLIGVGGCDLDGWRVRSSGNMTNGKGYSAYVNAGSTIDITGTPNTGSISIAGLLGNLFSPTPGKGWHLLGNPYPSPMNSNTITDGDLTSAQYYMVSGPYMGTFVAFTPGQPVAVGQGFVAEHAGFGYAVYNVENSDRIAANNTTWYSSEEWFTSKLEIVVMGNGFGDKATLFYSENNTASFDAIGDCVKKESNNGQPTIYTNLGDKELGLNGNSLAQIGESVPMGVKPGADGTFTLSFAGMETFEEMTTIYVEDKLLGTYHNVANGDYSYTALETDNNNRFEIHFVLPVELATTNVDCQGNLGNISLESNIGSAERNFVLAQGATTISTDDLANLNAQVTAGEYVLTVSDVFGGNQVYNIEIEAAESIEADFTVSNTELFVGEMLVLNNTTANATSTNWTIDNAVITAVNNATYTFDEAGVYDVLMTVNNNECSDTKKETITVVNKTTAIRTVDGETINFYPNPVSDVLHIDFNSEISVTIIDYIGKTVINTTEKTIDLNHVATGIYFLEIFDENNKLIASEKIIKK